MLIQEVHTDLSAHEVIERAKEFFTGRASPYMGQISEQGDAHIKFGMEAGELLIGVVAQGDRNLVRGSASRTHHELSQFLTTLAPNEEIRQNLPGPGASGAG